ncbi:MAG: acyl-CoA/acyl-ACP dehydrogenase [Proteobacteria bacterium]|nr:acyl-CoA/acyl-ACP dehydrogenase [Pseudomonadota bacterium]
MDFSLSEEQQDLRDLARKILEDRLTNEHLKTLAAEPPVFDRPLWDELARANLLGASLPEEAGGSGYGFFELCVLLQECGRAVAPVPALACLALGAQPVARFGSPAQRKAWLPGVAEGRTILTAALHEPEADDPRQPTTNVRADGGDFVLDGRKTLVPFAQVADRVLVPARSAEGQVGVFLVDPSADGVTLETQRASNGLPHALLALTGVRVGAEDLLGELSSGQETLDWILDRAVAATCCVQLGVSERALEMTAEYARNRHQFDVPIGSFQAVHQRAADAYIQVEAIRLTAWEAAWRLAQDLPAEAELAIAKYWASEGGQFVAYAAQHLHGGIGIDVDYPLHRYFVWATQNEHSLGCAQAQLATLGQRLAAEGIAPAR